MTTDPSYEDSVQRTESPPPSSNKPATVAATATGSANAGGISTAPSYSPIYTTAQPAGMVGPGATGLPSGSLAGGSLGTGTAIGIGTGAGTGTGAEGSGNGLFTPSETTNPTPTPAPSTTRSSVSGARSEVLAPGLGLGQSQGQGGVPPPPKTGEPVMPSGFYQPAFASGPTSGPGPVFRGSATGAQGYGGYSYSQGQGQGLGQGYGYGHGHGQGYPNSTSAPYSSVYHDSSVLDGDAEPGFLDVAKGWMQTAGDKLVQVEAEVWRRINDAHGR